MEKPLDSSATVAYRHSRMTQTNCSDCGNAFPNYPAGHVGGIGYATLPNDQRICYDCADRRQVEETKDRTRPFIGYLKLVNRGSWLGYQITSWTGGKLMQVTSARPCKLTRQSWTHDRNGFMSIHAVDMHGGHWAGRGSDGLAIKLRPVKG